jgi:glucose-6-phosphate isomerase
MIYSHDIENCLAAGIGKGGLGEAAFAAALDRLRPSLERLRAARADGSMAHLGLPARTDDLAEIAQVAAALRANSDIIVLGTGGSSLGGATLAALGRDASAPRLHFLDNVDPDGFDGALARLDPARTGALIVSKSGTTAETLAQALILLPWMEKGGAAGARAFALSDPAKPGAQPTPLARLAARYGLAILDHDAAIGGRFAALTNVGLIPAAVVGLDPAAIRKGAASALAMSLDAADPARSPACAGAALAFALCRDNGVSQSVLLPYIDRLAPFGLWYRQLWAESLGKGGQGTTPIAARGTVDQHSQLQLWLDGPADKMFTLILGEAAGTGGRLDAALAGGAGLEYLDGRTMGDLLAAEQEATAETLIRSGRPTRIMRIVRADGETMGALMMHFMLETILAADLFGVDPFDQPAVEDGKRLARARLAAMKGKAQ